MTRDPMGDRMKDFETRASFKLDPRLPICVRIDGRAFHTFTRKLDKPFDEKLCQLMIATTSFLVEETHARIGYTQSDEISLILYYPELESQPLFGGKIQKLSSVLASLATAYFVKHLNHLDVAKLPPGLPTFDCRVWNVPDEVEAANVILWRWFDAKRNSVSTLAHAHFNPKQLHMKSSKDMLIMLQQQGVDWNSLPLRYKYGSFVRRITILKELTPEELDKIPAKHRPSGPVLRSISSIIELPPLDQIQNIVGVILGGQAPALKNT